MIKLIASDLDGTLIGHDFRFRPRTLRALEAARAAGIDIVFVTGRPSRWLTPLREQTDFDSYAICSNGAVVYHLGANEVEEVNGADPAVIARAHELLEPMFPDATYTLETADTVYIQGPHDGGEVLEGARVVEAKIAEALERIGSTPVIKYLIRVPGMEAHEVMAFGDMPNDAEMLCWAGDGFAMASGQPALIAKVGRTCPPFEEDGVAQTIEAMLAERF